MTKVNCLSASAFLGMLIGTLYAVEAPALSQEVLYPTPGLVRVNSAGDTGSSANRGAHRLNGRPYFVNGGSLYRLNADFTLENLGLVEGVGGVSMADNGSAPLGAAIFSVGRCT